LKDLVHHLKIGEKKCIGNNGTKFLKPGGNLPKIIVVLFDPILDLLLLSPKRDNPAHHFPEFSIFLASS
jgi:hypothetical protein